ncbi:MAG: hypothetical protein CMJ34_13740 [Phycisphaerae bacterium]|nr:hypothetical protein [Phycisphaerae bacterium]
MVPGAGLDRGAAEADTGRGLREDSPCIKADPLIAMASNMAVRDLRPAEAGLRIRIEDQTGHRDSPIHRSNGT